MIQKVLKAPRPETRGESRAVPPRGRISQGMRTRGITYKLASLSHRTSDTGPSSAMYVNIFGTQLQRLIPATCERSRHQHHLAVAPCDSRSTQSCVRMYADVTEFSRILLAKAQLSRAAVSVGGQGQPLGHTRRLSRQVGCCDDQQE
jgi:hypothetical protein